ncbi:MAG: hypothetical protein ACOYMV_12150, partial [Verrucomicrobiia bacterium]
MNASNPRLSGGSFRPCVALAMLLGLAVAPCLPAAVVTNIYAGPGSTNFGGSLVFDGDSNSYFEISGGYQVTNTSVSFGSQDTTKFANALVTGSGTVWYSSAAWFDFGGNNGLPVGGNNMNLTVSSGATVYAQGILIGRGPLSTNNRFVVTGGGSLVSNMANGLYIGYNGSGESFIVRDGARYSGAGAGLVRVGNTASYASSNNLVQVSGAGSLFRTAADVLIGDGNGTWGNQVVVDSEGFLTTVASIEVGRTGSGSSLLVTNGGHVGVGTIHISKASTSSNNTILISGAGTISVTGTGGTNAT